MEIDAMGTWQRCRRLLTTVIPCNERSKGKELFDVEKSIELIVSVARQHCANVDLCYLAFDGKMHPAGATITTCDV